MKRDEDSGGMWCLVMFDLPVKTKRQRHAATVFRNMLLDMGYGMVQYSVYVRYTPTQSGNRATVKMIKDNLPANGLVRILHIAIISGPRRPDFLLENVRLRKKRLTFSRFFERRRV